MIFTRLGIKQNLKKCTSLKKQFSSTTMANKLSKFNKLALRQPNFYLSSKSPSTGLMGSRVQRNFCQQHEGSQEVAMTLTQEEIDQKSQFEEEVLQIDENNQVSIKFNDDSITYEIPEELHGTTFGKSTLFIHHSNFWQTQWVIS